jgi:hypothetical protein
MIASRVKQEMLRIADELSGIDLTELSPVEKKIARLAFEALGWERIPETGGIVDRPRHQYAEQTTQDCERCGHPENHWMHNV